MPIRRTQRHGDPSIGTTAPLLAANDQHGKPQTLDTLKGSKGLLFVFNRSVDW